MVLFGQLPSAERLQEAHSVRIVWLPSRAKFLSCRSLRLRMQVRWRHISTHLKPQRYQACCLVLVLNIDCNPQERVSFVKLVALMLSYGYGL